MASPITFTGLGSGIDLASVVESIIETERLRFIQPYEDWQTSWENKITSFQELNSKLVSLQTNAKNMDSSSEFLVKSAASSDDDVLSVSASSSSLNGSYAVEVNQLAQSEKEIHAGFADSDTTAVHNDTLFDGEFIYTYDGETRTVNVDAGTTLSGLVDLINNDVENPGVTASILNDGTGGATAYHLVLSGTSTGTDYSIDAISHSLDNMSGNGAAGGDFTETQSAQNAQLAVDGYPAGPPWIERSSNTVTDVIPGVTLNLTATTSGTAVTVTVNTDTAAIKQKVYDFVDSFNEVRSYIAEQTTYDSNTNVGGVLQGNYGVDIIKNRLNEIVSSTANGFRDGTDTYTNLMQIGISTDAEDGSSTQGLLVIDDSVLDTALAADAQAVSELFSDSFVPRSAHGLLEYEGHTPFTESGTYEIFFNHLNPSQSRMRLHDGEWHTGIWDAATQTLTGPSDTPESGLVVRITNIGSSFTGEVDLKQGVAGEMKEELDFLTNTYEGPLAVLEDNYQDIIDNIEDKIEREEKRINLYEQRLTERYARLEALLTELESQSSYLSMQVSSWESS